MVKDKTKFLQKNKTLHKGGGVGDSCRVTCKNKIVYDCFSNTSGSCNQGCSANETSCTGYNSDCHSYTYTCDAS